MLANTNYFLGEVLSMRLSTPPGSPSVGDRYIVGPSATGVWTSLDAQIVEWNGSSWDMQSIGSWVVVFVRAGYTDEGNYQLWYRNSFAEWYPLSKTSQGERMSNNNKGWQAPVLSSDVSNPPAAQEGDRYIPKATATGAWAGFENYIIEHVHFGNTWNKLAPTIGMRVVIADAVDPEDDGKLHVYNGSAWVPEDVSDFSTDIATNASDIDDLETNMAAALAAIAALEAASGGFVDRGDPDSEDWDKNDFTKDSVWRDLDCSGIVPAGAKTISLRILAKSSGAGENIHFRKNGNSNGYNIYGIRTQVANYTMVGNITVPCDEDRKLEYSITAGTYENLFVTVTGWTL